LTEKTALPQWDLTNVYPSLESEEFKQGNLKIISLTDQLQKYMEDNQIDPKPMSRFQR